jgi:hypothetical protein
MSASARAPIAVFAYTRDVHLARTLDSLSACRGFADAPVIIFSDGPRNEQTAEQVAKVRAMLQSRRTPNMRIVEAPSNKGLARSIVEGVNSLTEEFGRVIVIEDDLLLHPAALEWFNGALDRFQDDPDIYHVNAYQFRVPAFRNRQQGLILPFASSWGWATWKRAWQVFDPSAEGWEILSTDNNQRRAFNLDDSFPLAEYLTAQMQGRHDSWASRWIWSIFKRGGQVVMPPSSLVRNIGFDETATHNGLGLLRRFVHMPEPFLWDRPEVPDLPAGPSPPADLRTFQRALRATGALRRARIRQTLRNLTRG